jgi:hypothetical protein
MENAQNISKKNATERRRWLSRDTDLGSSDPAKTRRMEQTLKAPQPRLY